MPWISRGAERQGSAPARSLLEFLSWTWSHSWSRTRHLSRGSFRANWLGRWEGGYIFFMICMTSFVFNEPDLRTLTTHHTTFPRSRDLPAVLPLKITPAPAPAPASSTSALSMPQIHDISRAAGKRSKPVCVSAVPLVPQVPEEGISLRSCASHHGCQHCQPMSAVSLHQSLSAFAHLR